MAVPAQGQDGMGRVSVPVRVGRDGAVREVVAEQVNLRVLVPPRQLDTGRAAFADSAMRAVRDWTFRIPTQGPQADRQTWGVRPGALCRTPFPG